MEEEANTTSTANIKSFQLFDLFAQFFPTQCKKFQLKHLSKLVEDIKG
jgi:hypothetical protein